ncbi:MAG: hypothetical protein F4Z50_07790 [Gemmatimonadetes bacterium]|nr:hypothetical protein [Gemmatimonadota bacterium]MYD13963.1 hypothetical protein [Gemmatimonadota bacterium]
MLSWPARKVAVLAAAVLAVAVALWYFAPDSGVEVVEAEMLCESGIYYVLEDSPDVVRSTDPVTGGTTQVLLRLPYTDMTAAVKDSIRCVTCELSAEYDANGTSDRWYSLDATLNRLYQSSAQYRDWYETQAEARPLASRTPPAAVYITLDSVFPEHEITDNGGSLVTLFEIDVVGDGDPGAVHSYRLSTDGGTPVDVTTYDMGAGVRSVIVPVLPGDLQAGKVTAKLYGLSGDEIIAETDLEIPLVRGDDGNWKVAY